MFFTNLFNKKCQHNNIKPDVESAYCPDCGKLIKNEWYITRCACCGIRLQSVSKNGKVMPELHYCSNCGSKEYHVEKLDKIDFINIKYAVLVKKEAEETQICSTTRCWQEKTNALPKLLVECR